jgi:hypothetical protein
MSNAKLSGLEGAPVLAWMPKPQEEAGGAAGPTTVATEAVAASAKRLQLAPLVDPRPAGSPALRVRKDQKHLREAEWKAFVRALNAIADDDAAAPSWHDLVRVHIDAMAPVGMSWGVHHMGGMAISGEGRNFLAWHRAYLLAMEDRLRRVEVHVTIPYWNWVNDPELPAALSRPAMLKRLGVKRFANPESLPSEQQISHLLTEPGYLQFQGDLELGPHNTVHRMVGGSKGNAYGTMETSASPKDPLFWLHHAMVDNLWAHWEASAHGTPAPNGSEQLEPPPIITGTVESQVSVFDLGYTYR